MPRLVLSSAHRVYIQQLKKRDPAISYKEISRKLKEKYDVEVTTATIGNSWRTIKKNKMEGKQKEVYTFERILSHKFRKGEIGLIRAGPKVEIKWKNTEVTSVIKQSEFVDGESLIAYLLDKLYAYESRKDCPLTP